LRALQYFNEKATPDSSIEEIRELITIIDKRSSKFFQKIKFTRWGKSEDCKAFQKIRDYCNSLGITLDDLFTNDELSNNHRLWLDLCSRCEWKRESTFMKARFQKLYENTDFSVREMKLLKRLVKRQKKVGSINWEKISYNFPGKSAQLIKDTYMRDRNRSRRRRNGL